MVATSRHHGLPAPPDVKDGLHGALFNLWTPDRGHCHHQPNTTHLDPPPPKKALAVAGDLSSWDFPSVHQVLWVGKGAVGRVGLWDGGAAQALCADPPEAVPACPPPTPTTPPSSPGRPRPLTSPSSRSASSVCSSSLGACTRSRSARRITSMQSRRSTSQCRALLPRCGRPRCGMWRIRPQQGGRPDARRPGHGQSHAPVIARCACLCVCFVYWQIERNSREIHTKFVRNSYEIRTNFTE